MQGCVLYNIRPPFVVRRFKSGHPGVPSQRDAKPHVFLPSEAKERNLRIFSQITQLSVCTIIDGVVPKVIEGPVRRSDDSGCLDCRPSLLRADKEDYMP
jgi:hypothetical protein